jgi:hypothetical protein
MAPNHHPSPPMAMQLHRGPPGPPPPPEAQAGPYLPSQQLAALNEEVWLRLGMLHRILTCRGYNMLTMYIQGVLRRSWAIYQRQCRHMNMPFVTIRSPFGP